MNTVITYRFITLFIMAVLCTGILGCRLVSRLISDIAWKIRRRKRNKECGSYDDESPDLKPVTKVKMFHYFYNENGVDPFAQKITDFINSVDKGNYLEVQYVPFQHGLLAIATYKEYVKQ